MKGPESHTFWTELDSSFHGVIIRSLCTLASLQKGITISFFLFDPLTVMTLFLKFSRHNSPVKAHRGPQDCWKALGFWSIFLKIQFKDPNNSSDWYETSAVMYFVRYSFASWSQMENNFFLNVNEILFTFIKWPSLPSVPTEKEANWDSSTS